jgi:hypothetical protein
VSRAGGPVEDLEQLAVLDLEQLTELDLEQLTVLELTVLEQLTVLDLEQLTTQEDDGEDEDVAFSNLIEEALEADDAGDAEDDPEQMISEEAQEAEDAGVAEDDLEQMILEEEDGEDEDLAFSNLIEEAQDAERRELLLNARKHAKFTFRSQVDNMEQVIACVEHKAKVLESYHKKYKKVGKTKQNKTWVEHIANMPVATIGGAELVPGQCLPCGMQLRNSGDLDKHNAKAQKGISILVDRYPAPGEEDNGLSERFIVGLQKCLEIHRNLVEAARQKALDIVDPQKKVPGRRKKTDDALVDYFEGGNSQPVGSITGGKYQCGECEKVFIKTSQLYKHIVNQHGTFCKVHNIPCQSHSSTGVPRKLHRLNRTQVSALKEWLQEKVGAHAFSVMSATFPVEVKRDLTGIFTGTITKTQT